MNPAAEPHDAIILGGGLAGLTLALQLRQRFPDIDVLVLERRSHPVPLACHKVGESSVEIGARYFEQLGLKQHLQDDQLRKFGFRFFFSEGRRDIENVTELGASVPLPVVSYQIDRGIFENFLGREALVRGARFVDDAVVRKVELADTADGLHAVAWQRSGGALQHSRARWVVDASGRAGLLKRQLGLAKDNDHACHAVWFRIKGRIDVDGWSDSPEWAGRCFKPNRWLSTNHLVGAGYWVWLIPLASGSHSVGIVADPRLHPLERMNNFERAMAWLQEFQPRLFDELDGRRGELQDFAYLRRFSYDCKQVFSADRWALTGEAGRFLDPFYSPGSDFIAIGNTFITELIARDRTGQRLQAPTQVYEQIVRSFYDSTLSLYTDQYALFGDPEVLPVKVLWDYTYYWGVLSQLYFQGRLTDVAALSSLKDALSNCQRLNAAVQAFLRDWSVHSDKRSRQQMLDQSALDWFVELNRSLLDTLDDAAFKARIRQSSALLLALAEQLLQRACGDHPGLDGSPLRAAIAAAGPAREPHPPLLFPRVQRQPSAAVAA